MIFTGIGRVADDHPERGGFLAVYPFGVLLKKAFEGLLAAVFQHLEGVSQADAIKGRVCCCAGEVMPDAFNVDRRDVIGQQNDFIGMDFLLVLAEKILLPNQAADTPASAVQSGCPCHVRKRQGCGAYRVSAERT